MELWLVADTNLFFECKSLEQLPWEELGHDPIVILLTKPVLDEIDKHKKATGRTRSRALEIFGRVRVMLTKKVQEVDICPSRPRIVLRLAQWAKPDPQLKDELDYDKTDERLVGIVSALQADASERLVMLFTDDTGPASTAVNLGVPYLLIDESWRRPASESTEAKKIRELEKDLATYRAQEPNISIGSCENANSSNVIEVTRRVATALTEREIEEIISALCAKHPLRTEFVPPPPSSVAKANGEIIRTEYLPPPDEAIAEYRDVLYPQWIEKCRSILAALHEGRDVDEPPLIIRWPMSNVGTRPASQVRVEFEAKGPLKLVRLPNEYPDEDDDIRDGPKEAAPSRSAPTSKFPSPPRAPRFQENVTRIPPPVKPKLMPRPPGASSVIASDVLRQNYGGLTRSIAELEKARLLPLSRHLGLGGAAADAARLFARPSIFEPPFSSALGATATLMPTTRPRISALTLPPRHDPEAFYWDWPAEEAVKTGALTCDLWRHQTVEQIFEFEVLFDQEGEARGTVECSVHAENLTKPEQARCIVGRVLERFSVREIAAAMVEACT